MSPVEFTFSLPHMKVIPQACVVLCDYPIKTIAYQRFLGGLGERAVYSFGQVDPEVTELTNAKLVVCDMNIMRRFEAKALRKIEQTFPKANILFFEEDHGDMRIKFSNKRDICRLGKLAELNVIYGTLKELLLQNRKYAKTTAIQQEHSTQV